MMNNSIDNPAVGLGGGRTCELDQRDFSINLHLGKRPPLEGYLQQGNFRPVEDTELLEIGRLTGNHWRKIINCYAKLAYELEAQLACGEAQRFKRWQDYRDFGFLREHSRYRLGFSAPILSTGPSTATVTLLSGRAYGQLWTQEQGIVLEWLNSDFAINRQYKLLVTPYFDYRQLSNVKITELVALIQSLR